MIHENVKRVEEIRVDLGYSTATNGGMAKWTIWMDSAHQIGLYTPQNTVLNGYWGAWALDFKRGPEIRVH